VPAGLPQDDLFYVGSVEEKKGASFLLDGYRRLREWMGGCSPKLVIAGGVGGQAYDLESAVRSRGLFDHVLRLGAVSNDQKRSLMAGARAFVFPSLYEGFGIPPLEAMCFGTPVVSTRSTSLPEVLGNAAEYAEPGDVDSLARAMQRLLTDEDRRMALAKAGLAQVDRYQWSDAAATLIECFSRLERTL
jgi:glycosyltransferase involved in cell wall biosynthesis